MKTIKQFWVLDSDQNVVFRSHKKHSAAAFVAGLGSGSIVKVKPVELPPMPIRKAVKS